MLRLLMLLLPCFLAPALALAEGILYNECAKAHKFPKAGLMAHVEPAKLDPERKLRLVECSERSGDPDFSRWVERQLAEDIKAGTLRKPEHPVYRDTGRSGPSTGGAGGFIVWILGSIGIWLLWLLLRHGMTTGADIDWGPLFFSLVGVCLLAFAAYGVGTDAGRRQFDEMAGMLPGFAGLIGLASLAIGIGWFIHRRSGR